MKSNKLSCRKGAQLGTGINSRRRLHPEHSRGGFLKSYVTLRKPMHGPSMSTFGGQIRELENILIDNFVEYKSHTCFFLSHCHSDHMRGLDEFFSNINLESNNYIYCSSISRLILLNRYGCVYKKMIIELTSPKMLTIPGNDNSPSYQVTVTPIPAGHCLGSIMFLFETVSKTVLYTGDFRLFKNDISSFKPFHSKNQIKLIDTLYVDSTFLSDSYWDFPSRSEVTIEVLKVIKSWLYKSPNHRVLLVVSALYGYEFVFIELAKNLKCKIHVKDALYNLFFNIPEVGCFLTNNCKSTKIHAACNFDKKCLSIEDEKLLRIKLSAQWYKSSKDGPHQKVWKEISKQNILFCYSTHCSCSELVNFMNYLQPKSIEPCTIAVGSTEEDTKAYIEQLCRSWSTRKEAEQRDTAENEFALERHYRFKLEVPQCAATNFEEAFAI